jgi:lipoprotein-releasing system ATP-binding protein
MNKRASGTDVSSRPPEGAAIGFGGGAADGVVLKVRGLTKRFHEGRIDLTVLHGVDLDVRAGETLAIVGARARARARCST